MDKIRLHDLLDGFWAWDIGASDSGVNCSVVRAEVLTYIGGLSNQQQKKLLVDFITAQIVADDQYVVEDIRDVSSWFCDFIAGEE